MLFKFLICFFKYFIASPFICLYAVGAGWREGELLRYLRAVWKGEKFFFCV